MNSLNIVQIVHIEGTCVTTINNVVESFKILDFLLTKYQKIISSCYFGKFRVIFVPIEKHNINFLKKCSFCNKREF